YATILSQSGPHQRGMGAGWRPRGGDRGCVSACSLLDVCALPAGRYRQYWRIASTFAAELHADHGGTLTRHDPSPREPAPGDGTGAAGNSYMQGARVADTPP